jgi:Spy/CpxP family protein refolding chaperone
MTRAAASLVRIGQSVARVYLFSGGTPMLRTLSVVLTLGAAYGLCAFLQAADEKTDQNGDKVTVVMIRELNLTDQQEAKIADIRKENRPKIEEAAKELATITKEEEEKVRGVLTPAQLQKVQEFKEERKERRHEGLAQRIAHLKDFDLTEAEVTQIEEIRKEFRPKIEEAMKKFTGVLTEDQKKAREEALKAGKPHREVREALNLTGDQKEKLEAAAKDLATQFREEMEKIRGVLSEEQQRQLTELKDERKEHARDRMAHRIANLGELDLTEEQKTKIADIRKEFRPKVHEAGSKLRGAIKEELESIAAVLKG